MSKELMFAQPSTIEIAERKFALMQRQATGISKSDLVPKEYKENMANCLIAIEIADRIGASPLMVMQNLAIIHGRPSWSSTFIISAINSCGRFKPLRFRMTKEDQVRDFHYEIFETEWINKQKTTKVVNKTTKILNKTCVAWTTDTSGEVLESPEVSIEMACIEGWYDKSGSKWKTMPDLMLRYRSAAFFGRLYAPDVLMGMHTAEEVEDMGLKDITPKAESPVLANINDAIRAEAAKENATDVNPETGEVIEQAADNSPPTQAEVKPTEPKTPELPTFDINAYNINTAAGAKSAAAEFVKVLAVYPEAERPAVFLASSGITLIGAMRNHGQNLDIKKMEALGISLPAEADSAADEAPAVGGSNKLFAKKDAAA
jgi:hypothetical protein